MLFLEFMFFERRESGGGQVRLALPIKKHMPSLRQLAPKRHFSTQADVSYFLQFKLCLSVCLRLCASVCVCALLCAMFEICALHKRLPVVYSVTEDMRPTGPIVKVKCQGQVTQNSSWPILSTFV